MGKRGPKPKGKVKIKWSPNFAYVIGLLASDGNLSPDGYHLNLTSKDFEVIELFRKCLLINNKIGRKARSNSVGKKYYVVQFGDVLFYKFLLGIGLTPAKSKTIENLDIPYKYFFDFLRGSFDGDGCFYSYWDPRWRSSFMFYTSFASASKKHIDWLRREIFERLKARGHITKDRNKITYQLKYAKKDSLKIIKSMYYSTSILCLSRKREKIIKALKMAGIKEKMPGWRNRRRAALRWLWE